MNNLKSFIRKYFCICGAAVFLIGVLTSCGENPAVSRDESAEETTAAPSIPETTEATGETQTTEATGETPKETAEEIDLESAAAADAERLKELNKELYQWYEILLEDNAQAEAYLSDNPEERLSHPLSESEREYLEKVYNCLSRIREVYESGRDLDARYQRNFVDDDFGKYESEIKDMMKDLRDQHERYQDCFNIYLQALEETDHIEETIGLYDFCRMSGWREDDFVELYGEIDDRPEGWIRFDDIYFCGHEGHLRVAFDGDGTVNCVSWTSYTSSEELYQELFQYVRGNGSAGHTREPREGQIEEGTYVDGVEVFAGYEDSENGQYTYVFAEYPNQE